jgi:hypothetical protein
MISLLNQIPFYSVTEAELVTAEDKGTCKDLVKVDKTER